MPLVSVAAQNTFLDRMWATAPGALVEVGLLSGDPRLGGVELAAVGGYARHQVTPWAGFWLAAAGGVKRSVLFSFPDTTGLWPVAAAWEGIWVDGSLWDAMPLLEPVIVTDAGPGIDLRLSRHFSTTL